MLAFNEPLQIKDDDGFISMTPYETIEVWIFSVCAPQYVMLPPVTEHVSLHNKSLCKNIARASGGCK